MKMTGDAALKILVVDDEPSVSRSIMMLLAHEGHSVMTAADGEMALLALDQNEFDLIITDFSMPGMNGVQLATHIKQRWPQRPIIIATASMYGLESSGGLPVNVDYLLNKPFSLEELRQAIDQVRP